MVLLINKEACQECWACSVKSELNGLPEMAFEGVDMSNWAEADAQILGMILLAKGHCPNKAMSVLTSTEFYKLKRGVDEGESR